MTVELLIRNGDYVPDGAGSLCRLTGEEEMLARVLYRLTARRGGLPFLPRLGSRLYLLPREKPSARQTLAAQYVAEALEEEPELKVTEVILTEDRDQAELTVWLEWNGSPASVTVELQGEGSGV